MQEHSDSHGGGEPPAPLQQSLDEIAFQNGLWGFILRGASAPQVAEFIRESSKNRSVPPGQVVDQLDKGGYTPLLYASRAGNRAVCDVLLSNGADPNAVTPGLQQSCLHRVASQGHLAVVECLLSAGTNPSLLDTQGKTAADCAENNGHSQVLQCLKRSQNQ